MSDPSVVCFAGINVPRRRFLPVKKTSDLLVVMSNLFTLRHGTLVMNPERTFPTMPLVKLGDPDFTKVRGDHKIKKRKKFGGGCWIGGNLSLGCISNRTAGAGKCFIISFISFVR